MPVTCVPAVLVLCCCCVVLCRMPGLWMSAISRMGRLLQSCKQQLAAAGDPRAAQLPIPPVFNHCTATLGEAEQQQARDLYWKAISSPELQGPQHAQQVLELYQQAVQLNPYMAEPHLMLAQLHVQAGRWEEGEMEARQALQLFLDWGTPCDKVGWGMVVLVLQTACWQSICVTQQ